MQVNAQDALDSSVSIYLEESIKEYRFRATLLSVSFLFSFPSTAETPISRLIVQVDLFLAILGYFTSLGEYYTCSLWQHLPPHITPSPFSGLPHP